MDSKKEWYEGVACGYMEGSIDEIISTAKRNIGLDKCNALALCDGCSLCMAIGVFTGISGMENIMVIHGPTGCAQLQGTVFGVRFVTTTSREDLKGPNYYVPYFVCSGIEEKEVVFGGIKKLREAIFYADRTYRPKLITILTTCSTQVIGDDVEGLIGQLKGKVNAELMYLPTSGLNKSFDGYDFTYKAIIDRFVLPSKDKIRGSVNILADKRRTGGEINFSEIARVLKKLGIKINCRFIRNTTLENIKNLTKAELNLMMCHHAGIVSARYLKEKFGMPYIEYDYPMGIAETKGWYQEILEALNMEDREGILEAEYQKAYPRFMAAKEVLEGKTIACVGSPGRMVRYMDIIYELGLRPVYLSIYMHMRDVSFQMLHTKLKKYGFDPHILIQTSPFNNEENLAKLKPDLMFGDPSDSHFAFRNDIAFCHLESAPQAGFSGTLNIAERWADAVRRPVYDFWHKYTDIPHHTPREF